MVDVKVEASTKRVPPKKESTLVKNEKPQTIQEQRTDAIDGIFQLVGLVCILLGQYADAGAIDMHQHDISIEVAKLAETNSGIAKGVDTLLEVGPYAGLVMAVMPLALQLLANHKIVPAEKMTNAHVVRPELLESQVKTVMAKRAIQALKEQQQAEEELAKMQEEMVAYQNGQNAE